MDIERGKERKRERETTGRDREGRERPGKAVKGRER
jgi:hypothetical protein